MKITIPRPIVSELFNRLEEQGSYEPTDEVHTLYIKIKKAYVLPKISINEVERQELIHHCEVMIELDKENYHEEPYKTEAKYARQLLQKLKGTNK